MSPQSYKRSSNKFLEKEVASHSSILACRIPWTDESGRQQSMGSQRVGHNLVTTRNSTQPLPKRKILSLFSKSVCYTNILEKLFRDKSHHKICSNVTEKYLPSKYCYYLSRRSFIVFFIMIIITFVGCR